MHLTQENSIAVRATTVSLSQQATTIKMKFSIASTALLAGIAAAKNLRRSSNPNHITNAVYKNPKASVKDRVEDPMWRMTIEEKTSKLVQGNISNWINMTDNSFNLTRLESSMATRRGSFYVSYPVGQHRIADGVKIGQDYSRRTLLWAYQRWYKVKAFMVSSSVSFISFWVLFGLLVIKPILIR
jgi:hypothetical protein